MAPAPVATTNPNGEDWPRALINRQPAWVALAVSGALLLGTRRAPADDEATIVTPPGFHQPGQAKTASGGQVGRLRITVRDRATEKPTPCRLNVIGPDGNFYQPAPNPLSPYSLTGHWPKTGRGNREHKAPIRYLGCFFYTAGQVEITVPAGSVRIEAWKGFEYRPRTARAEVLAGRTDHVLIELEHTAPVAALGYHSGDPHLHFPRKTEADDDIILDLLAAEDIKFGSILAYNEPAGSYTGAMDAMDAPQLQGLGRTSVHHRDANWLASGQEYRSTTYGHLNLLWRDDLVLKDRNVITNDWPLYGTVGRDTRRHGGIAIYAHGGYGQAIYADFVQKSIDAVELLQFGIYRGIGLADWYHILNIGYRFPCVGASDYPACRKLGDCQTYVHLKEHPDFASWLRNAAEGRSFVTTGPLLLLEVEGERPGGIIRRTAPGVHRIRARVRTKCEVAPIQTVQLVVNGHVALEHGVPSPQMQGKWIELERTLELSRSSWIAARAFGQARSGAPDAEAHTNPVYVDIGASAPYDRDSLDCLVARIDEQMTVHRQRSFAEKAQVLDYFQKSRDLLLRIRQAGGLPVGGIPDHWIEDVTSAGVDASRRVHSTSELARFLQPPPATTPAEALGTFETADGFRMELVAHEPLVQSPVAAAFDADGDLYVAEMRDYPYKPKPGHKALGVVRLLHDSNGDGRFDQSHVFADGLLWAAGIAPWKGGVFVSAPPDIWYLKDTDGDHKADVRRRVYTGFGTQNPQAMVNNLVWGLDHKIYGAAGGNGGMIHTVDNSQAPVISVDRMDFCFDPVTEVFEPVTGTKQFGNTFDDWGNRFVCTQDSPLLQPVLPYRELARNPYLLVPEAFHNIVGSPVSVFRISPVERWRQIRSSRRIAHGERAASSSGASHHVVDAAAGVTVYRGGAYPKEFYGNVFVGDAQNNLIHRRILIPNGPTFQAVRGPHEQQTEFVRSSDNWFRPVNFVNAPDGTLYVLDMSRAIIEAIHIPLDVVQHLDLKRGRDQGRIYRITPKGFRFTSPAHLSHATTSGLVAGLTHTDAWYRDTAHRLLYERQDCGAVEPLRRLLSPSYAPLPQSRVNALWSLEGLKALRDQDIAMVLVDPVPQVRAQAVEIASGRLEQSPELFGKVIAAAGDADPRVRFRVALALGKMRDPHIGSPLLQIARADAANRWIRSAVLCSSPSVAARLLEDLWKDPNPPTPAKAEGRTELLAQLARVIAGQNRPEEVASALDQLAGRVKDGSQLDLRNRLVLELARGLSHRGSWLLREGNSSRPGTRLVARLVEEAKVTTLNQRATEAARVEAIRSLSALDPTALRLMLAPLLEPHQPQTLRVAAVRAMATDRSPAVAGILLAPLSTFEPSVRTVTVQTLLARTSWTKALLQALECDIPGFGISPALIEPVDRAFLLKHRDPEVLRLAQALFGKTATHSRGAALAEYTSVLQATGDAARGAKVFERECSACHMVGGRGTPLGPDLTGSPSSDAAALLANILDPNANVLPSYVQYLVLDQSGRVYSGIITSETATGLTLRRAQDMEDIIERTQIAQIINTGRSFMPEGFENTVSKPEMADLLAFLQAAHRGSDGARTSGPDQSQPLDIGTLPGLLEPDD